MRRRNHLSLDSYYYDENAFAKHESTYILNSSCHLLRKDVRSVKCKRIILSSHSSRSLSLVLRWRRGQRKTCIFVHMLSTTIVLQRGGTIEYKATNIYLSSHSCSYQCFGVPGHRISGRENLLQIDCSTKLRPSSVWISRKKEEPP